MAVAAWLISLVMGVSLIPQEIERRTIYTILAKPVKRYEFIIGKFLGAMLTLAINIGLMGAGVHRCRCVQGAWAPQQPRRRPTAGRHQRCGHAAGRPLRLRTWSGAS